MERGIRIIMRKEKSIVIKREREREREKCIDDILQLMCCVKELIK